MSTGEPTGPRVCVYCGSMIVPMAGRQCRALRVERVDVDLDENGAESQPGTTQTWYCHHLCACAADRAAEKDQATFQTG